MFSFIFTAILMFVLWLCLSGQTTPLFLILGAVSSLLVAFWSRDLLIGKQGINLRTFFRFIAYIPWLIWQIVLSNLHLIYLVLHPKMPIEPRIIRFKHNLKTNFGIVLLANSITLTPGTVTIDANHDEFIVHAVSRKTAEDLLSGSMLEKVKHIEDGNGDEP